MKMGRFEKQFINAAGHGRRVAESVEQRLPIVPYLASLKYLDVGCGNGVTAMHLAAKYGFDVTGIDVDPEQIRVAREAAGRRADIRFLVGDATRLPFDDAAFDIVATNKTTHHIRSGRPSSPKWFGSCGRAGTSSSATWWFLRGSPDSAGQWPAVWPVS